MSVILAGLDVSGDRSKGNYKYLGVVLCTKEHLDAYIKRLGLNLYNLDQIKARRIKIIPKLNFDSDEFLVYCVRIDRGIIADKAKKMNRNKRKRIPTLKIFQLFNYAVWELLEDQIRAFVKKHGCELQDIQFECDSDCRRFVKDLGHNPVSRGYAYVVADMVGIANNWGIKIPGVRERDFRNELEDKLLR